MNGSDPNDLASRSAISTDDNEPVASSGHEISLFANAVESIQIGVEDLLKNGRQSCRTDVEDDASPKRKNSVSASPPGADILLPHTK
jgi:hypothetical protein